MSKLSYKQIWWLDSRGGRTENDMEEDDQGLFCWFGSGGRLLKRVSLPSDEEIEVKVYKSKSLVLKN